MFISKALRNGVALTIARYLKDDEKFLPPPRYLSILRISLCMTSEFVMFCMKCAFRSTHNPPFAMKMHFSVIICMKCAFRSMHNPPFAMKMHFSIYAMLYSSSRWGRVMQLDIISLFR